MAPSFRRKNRNLSASRPEKENEGIKAGQQPLSPRLVRCKSDNSQRTCTEINPNKSSAIPNVALSAEAKISNLMQLNGALVKEIASLRISHTAACNKFSELEASLRAEDRTLTDDLSSFQEKISVLKKEKAAMLASQEELQTSLCTSRAQVEGLSMELVKVKADNQGLTSAEAQQKINMQMKEVEILLTEKEAFAFKAASREREATQRIQFLEDSLHSSTMRVDSLTLQLKEEREKYVQVLNSGEQESAKRLSDLQASKDQIESLRMQLQKEVVDHQDEIRFLHEKLDESSQKVRAMEELLHESSSSADAFIQQLLRDLEHQKHNFSQCHILKDALLSEKETLLSEKVALEVEISSLRVNVEKLSNEKQDVQRAHVEKEQKSLSQLKQVERAVSDLEIEQSHLLKQLNMEKMAVAAAQERISSLESSKKTLVREHFVTKEALLREVSAKQIEISAMHDEVQNLREKNARLIEQEERLNLENSGIVLEKQRMVKNLMALEDDKTRASETISSLKHELQCLQLAKDQLTGESKLARTEAEVAAMDNTRLSRDLAFVESEKAQLQSQISEFSAEIIRVRECVEAAGVVQAKQDEDIGLLHNEIAMLTAANSELLSSLNTYDCQGKLLMLEAEKKEEQLAFLSRLSADLEISHSALQCEIEKQKAVCEVLESDNAVLQSSIETKAKAILALESQVDDSAKRSLALESQIEAMSSRNNVLELQLKAFQAEAIAHNVALDAEKHEKASIQRLLEEKNIEIKEIQEQARVNLDSLVHSKDNELGSLRAQLATFCQKNSDLATMLETCNSKNVNLVAQLRNIEVELAAANSKVLEAEKDLSIAAKLEGELTEASNTVSMLEAQLKAKVSLQIELESQVISLQNDLQDAYIASAKAEEDWKANMEAIHESANVRSRALEEQLECVKKMLGEMQSSASKGQESIVSLQDQVSCLMEEKSTLEKKVLRQVSALETKERNAEEARAEGGMTLQSQKRLDEKTKFVRLALPVFLISAASSLVIAGIQSYMKKLEN